MVSFRYLFGSFTGSLKNLKKKPQQKQGDNLVPLGVKNTQIKLWETCNLLQENSWITLISFSKCSNITIIEKKKIDLSG